MKNSNLVPTPIVNANGVATTVYRKPSNTTTTKSALPATPARPAEADTLIHRVTELYNMHHESGFDYRPHLSNELQKYPEEELRTLDRALTNDDDLAHGVAESVVHGYNLRRIREAIDYYQATGSDHYWRTSSEILALAHYSATNNEADITTVDAATRKSIIALMTFPRLIDTLPETPSPFLTYNEADHHDSRVINNDDLATLIAQRPDDIEQLAALVHQYGTDDAFTLNGLLDGALPALAEGHL